jgi:hypothetical protein
MPVSVISMTGTKKIPKVIITAAVHVSIADQQTYWGAGGAILENTRTDLHPIRFFARSRNARIS